MKRMHTDKNINDIITSHIGFHPQVKRMNMNVLGVWDDESKNYNFQMPQEFKDYLNELADNKPVGFINCTFVCQYNTKYIISFYVKFWNGNKPIAQVNQRDAYIIEGTVCNMAHSNNYNMLIYTQDGQQSTDLNDIRIRYAIFD